jgi:DNA-binding transcriptional MocR family regulator
MTSQTGPFIQSAAPDGFTNLALGQPSPRLLPMELFAGAAAERLHPGADPLVLQYGTRTGEMGFRQALADFVSQGHGIDIGSEQLMAAGSISLSLNMMCDLFGRRRGLVISEDPTYFLARNIFESSGMDVVGVPVDHEGMIIDELERIIASGIRPDFVYTIPSFHNPTSVTLSNARRERLVALALRYDFMVVADEPYNLLYFGNRAPAPLATLDDGRERVISVSSFSKILGPGLRAGWIQAAPSLIERIADHGVISSGGALNPVITHIVGALLENGSLATHIAALRNTFQARKDALVTALDRDLPTLKFHDPAGGYFLWIKLPEGIPASRLLTHARRRDISFMPGSSCALSAELDDHIRLSFAFYEEAELTAAAAVLTAVIGDWERNQTNY